MNAKIILQRLAAEEDVRNNYTTFTGYRAAANVFTESADVTGHIEDGADYVAFFVDPSIRRNVRTLKLRIFSGYATQSVTTAALSIRKDLRPFCISSTNRFAAET